MNPTPSSASPVKPILPGVPVPNPCFLWNRATQMWIHGSGGLLGQLDLLAAGFTHYLVAPATADPATFPKADKLPVNSDDSPTHPRGASVAPTGERAVFAHDVITNCIVSPTVAAKFRQEGTRHELRDPETGIVVVVYTKANGHILVDEMRPPSAGTEQKERGEASKEFSSNPHDHGMKLVRVENGMGIWEPAPTEGTTTPRCDSMVLAWQKGNIQVDTPVPADFARQLERELNAAKTKAQGFLDRLKNCQHELDLHQQKLALTEKRLGEAQEATERAKSGGQEWCRIANNALTELDTLHAQLATSQARLVEVEQRLNTILTGSEEGGVPWLNNRIAELTLTLLRAESALAQAKQELQQKSP